MPLSGPSRPQASPAPPTASASPVPLASDIPVRVEAAALVRVEAAALQELASRLDSSMSSGFEAALGLLAGAADQQRPITLTGIGKSGLIAQKIAATLRSTAVPAHFLHPTEALHGDLGMLGPGDPVLALSASGETAELLALLPSLRRLRTPLIVLTGCPASTLARAAAVALDTSISEEACPHNLAPTASTTVMLALGDALALSLAQRRGFAPEHFAALHPAGRLGDRLARVADRMHTGDAIPSVSPSTPVPELIHEMSRKRLGLTTVLAPDTAHLLGIISDGDLRRMLEREGTNSLALTAADIMNPHPHTIAPTALCSAALAHMEASAITSLLVTTPAPDGSPAIQQLQGVLHLHDLWKLNLL